MKVFFTICSNNYLGQATVLGHSVRQYEPEATFLILLVDRKTAAIDYAAIPFEVLPAESIEPEFEALAAKYNIIELNTCIKPRVIEYLFLSRNADQVTYLDPDIQVYRPLLESDQALREANATLTPHILTPIQLDGKGPTENTFLRYGIYNLGFISARRTDESLALMRWWKERTYTRGYASPDGGMFVDQLYMNLAPLLFGGISVLRHEGYNVAPWNLHERVLSNKDGAYVVNDIFPLVFFHFSSFRVDSGELPLHHYNRFTMKSRPDLADLYAAYNHDLKNAGHARYAEIPWAYAKGKSLVRTGVTWSIRRLPGSITDRVFRMLKGARGQRAG